MTERAGCAYIIEEVRRLTGAGTTELTIASVDYFTGAQIQEILDSRRVRLSRSLMAYEPELSAGGGTAIYKGARIGWGWLEDASAGGNNNDFKITDSQGSIIGTSLYNLSAVDGYVRFTADQGGSHRYVTGWVHNPYKAAYDLLLSWSMVLARQPDWSTDNMAVKRSQKVKELREQMKALKTIAGLAPRIEVAKISRPDIYVEAVVKPPYKTDKIPSG
jgi:hypothetical protein